MRNIYWVPPKALVEILRRSDWLVVGVSEEIPTNNLPVSYIPWSSSDAGAFVKALNALLEERKEIGSVLVLSNSDSDCANVHKIAGEVPAVMFCLSGGRAAATNFLFVLHYAGRVQAQVARIVGSGIQRCGQDVGGVDNDDALHTTRPNERGVGLARSFVFAVAGPFALRLRSVALY